MKKMTIKILATILALSCTIGTNSLLVFAEEKEDETVITQEIHTRAVVSNKVEDYEYHLYSPGNYATFTTMSPDYEQSIVVDISGSVSTYAYDYMNAIDDAGIAYDRIQTLITRSQYLGITGLWLAASGPLAPTSFFAAIAAFNLSKEAQNYAVEMNDSFNDAERAYRYLYRHRIIENGGCVTIGGQEVCPMSE